MSERIPDYAQGFKDGFAAGLEEGKKLNDKTYTDGFIEGMKKTIPPPYMPRTTPNFEIKENCPKCGLKISGVMGYVCSSPNCPTFPQVTCGSPMTAYSTGPTDSFHGGIDSGLGKAIWP